MKLATAVAVVAAVAAVVVGTFVVAVGVWVLHEFGPAVVRDHAGMAAVEHRLRPVQDDLSAVPSPLHTKPAPAATFTGCGSDSGEVFEPQVSREWRLTRDARGHLSSGGEDQVTPAARRAGTQIVKDLISRGWVGRATLGRGDAATTLLMRNQGVPSHLTIQVFYDSVLATGQTSYDKVCGHIL